MVSAKLSSSAARHSTDCSRFSSVGVSLRGPVATMETPEAALSLTCSARALSADARGLELSTIISFTALCSDSLAWQGIDETVAHPIALKAAKNALPGMGGMVRTANRPRLGFFEKGRAADSLHSSADTFLRHRPRKGDPSSRSSAKRSRGPNTSNWKPISDDDSFGFCSTNSHPKSAESRTGRGPRRQSRSEMDAKAVRRTTG